MPDIRYTVLQVVNEVQRKLGLDGSTLSGNKIAIELVDFVNDTCTDLSDFGNWQELLVSANVTAIAFQQNYNIVTSANIKNIGDIYFTQRTGPLRKISIEEMRILTRVTAEGVPSQYTIFGVDSNSNPNIRVRPTPASAQAGGLFSVLYWTKPPQYLTTDASAVIPFPGDLVVQGTLARAVLNESGGTPSDKYTKIQQDYEGSRKEALNRLNGDTGWSVSFSPSFRGRRR